MKISICSVSSDTFIVKVEEDPLTDSSLFFTIFRLLIRDLEFVINNVIARRPQEILHRIQSEFSP